LFRTADAFDEDEMIPSLRYMFLLSSQATEFVPPSKEFVAGVVAPFKDLMDPL